MPSALPAPPRRGPRSPTDEWDRRAEQFSAGEFHQPRRPKDNTENKTHDMTRRPAIVCLPRVAGLADRVDVFLDRHKTKEGGKKGRQDHYASNGDAGKCIA